MQKWHRNDWRRRTNLLHSEPDNSDPDRKFLNGRWSRRGTCGSNSESCCRRSSCLRSSLGIAIASIIDGSMRPWVDCYLQTYALPTSYQIIRLDDDSPGQISAYTITGLCSLLSPRKWLHIKTQIRNAGLLFQSKWMQPLVQNQPVWRPCARGQELLSEARAVHRSRPRPRCKEPGCFYEIDDWNNKWLFKWDVNQKLRIRVNYNTYSYFNL